MSRNSWADRGRDENGNRGVYWEGDWEYTTLDNVDRISAGAEAKQAEAKEKEGRIVKYLSDIPELVLAGFVNYVNHGQPVGDFLTAVLENDLHRAVSHADPDSLAGLKPLVFLLYNEAPSQCWRHPDRVTAWLNMDADRRTELVDNCLDWQRFMEVVNTPPLEVA